MPDIHLDAQVFDLAFNPRHDLVYAGLLNGHIKTFSYDNDGACTPKFDIRPTKKTVRSLATSPDGLELYGVSKDKSIFSIDTATGKVLHTQTEAHDCAINRVSRFMSMLATGDDNGTIKLWDPRQISPIRTYTHHSDFISDFLWLQDKKQLVATSGDGTLSVLDVRTNKTKPFAQSENQEDELLSIISIKEHPHSVDALATLSEDVIVAGSSDGLVRVVQVLPNKLLGVIADHGTFPIERLRVDRNGAWLGSASHDDILKLTDIKDALIDSDDEESGGKDNSDDGDDDSVNGDGFDDNGVEDASENAEAKEDVVDSDSDSGDESDSASGQVEHEQGSKSPPEQQPQPNSDSDSEPAPAPSRKRKNKNKMNPKNNKKGKVDDGFFDEL
ncbi:hypothetical protein CTheo_7993 [Ceratobasidium theobromae]|uniref:WD repeat-containing protein JIP5 n=1 Tax=Ceratobasidium theobromae TaxID=1582974 RepID=A0A5N5QAW9_9AGAM|nr:hypothetical protein CTheo_7993 [Ceratobasidium theobromae]